MNTFHVRVQQRVERLAAAQRHLRSVSHFKILETLEDSMMAVYKVPKSPRYIKQSVNLTNLPYSTNINV